MADRNALIEEQVKSCMNGFKTAHGRFKQDPVNKQTTASFANQYDRFCLWAHDSKVSDGVLDHNLQDSSDLKECLAELLFDLNDQFTPDYSESSNILSSDMLEEIIDIIDNLVSLEPALESPAPLDQYSSLSIYTTTQSFDTLTLTQGKERNVSPGRDPNGDRYVQLVDAIIKDDPVLVRHFGANLSRFVEEIARKAAHMADDPKASLGKENLLQKLIEISLYHHVIYYDDISLRRPHKPEDRAERKIKLIDRITHLTTCLLPDSEGITLGFPFRGVGDSTNITHGKVQAILNQSQWPQPHTANASTGLQSDILEPLVDANITSGFLDRPLLVSIITDSSSIRQHELFPFWDIFMCGVKLEATGYPRESVKFVIWHMGPDDSITRAWEMLIDKPDSGLVTFVTADHPGIKWDDLDSGNNEQDLDHWLVETLFSSIERLKNAETNVPMWAHYPSEHEQL